MSENLKAFVLMPFDPEFNSIYEDLIKPALEDAGYNTSRADNFVNQQNIMRGIIQGIYTSHLIVADITALNPNVLYELGLCHGLQIPTILLAQSTEEVPFDLRSYRIQVYSTRFDEVHKLKQALTDIGKKHKQEEIVFGSPVTDFLPETSTKSKKDLNKSKKKSSDKKGVQIEEEKGFLDFIVDGYKAVEEVTLIMNKIAKETENIGNNINNNTSRVETLTENPEPGTALKVHKIALTVATEMTHYSKKIDIDLPKLENNINLLIESYSGYVGWLKPKTEEEKENVRNFRKTIAELLEGTTGGLEGARSFRNAVIGLRGISREINRASNQLDHTLTGLISTMEKVEAFCVKILPLIDEKLRD